MQNPPGIVYTDKYTSSVYYDMRDVASEIKDYPLDQLSVRLTRRTQTSTIRVITNLFHSEELWRRFGRFFRKVTDASLREKAGSIEDGIKAFLARDMEKATLFVKAYKEAALAAFFLISQDRKHISTLQEIINSL